jgi:hypothetical protein
MNLHPVLDVFRKHSAGIVALFFHPQPSDASFVTPGPKTKQKPGNILKKQKFSIQMKIVLLSTIPLMAGH